MKKIRNRNKADGTLVTSENKADARAEKEGQYISRLSEKELVALQKRKTVFMLLCTLFFALSLFFPVAGREKLFDLLWLTTLYVIFDVALILLSVTVSYQGLKKHKIRSRIYGADAPRRGFNRHTYFSYELFFVMHFVLAAVEITVSCLKLEVWGILNIVVVLASAVFGLLSRQVLYRANANNLDFLPPRSELANEQKNERFNPKDEQQNNNDASTAENADTEINAKIEKTSADKLQKVGTPDNAKGEKTDKAGEATAEKPEKGEGESAAEDFYEN